MSRAYRVRVSESEHRVIRAGDEVCTSLGMLDILPREEMAALLERELVARGFRKDGEVLRRDAEGVSVVVDPASGAVSARVETSEEVKLQAQREGVTFTDVGPTEKAIRKQLQARVQADLDDKARDEESRLQAEATGRLEKAIVELGPELNRAVNRATAEALKKKAAQLGRVKEIHDDVEGGSLTITVEV
jgi:hypothetical protein